MDALDTITAKIDYVLNNRLLSGQLFTVTVPGLLERF
jgi:hypothetical protein